MDEEQLVEAALFVSAEPISLGELSLIAGLEKARVKRIVESLRRGYEDRGGALEIKGIGKDQYYMQAKEALAAPLADLIKPAVSHEVLKTLSWIALKQPTTQADVIKARGYSAYSHIKELLNKEFLSAEPTGRTKLLSTTQKFADYFALPSEIAKVKSRMAEGLGEH